MHIYETYFHMLNCVCECVVLNINIAVNSILMTKLSYDNHTRRKKTRTNSSSSSI